MRGNAAWTSLALAAVVMVACGPARENDGGPNDELPEVSEGRVVGGASAPGADAAGDGVEDLRWRLLTIGGEPVDAPAEGLEARYFALYSERQGMAGFAGCNRISGSYEVEGASLRFSEVVSTRMACPDLAGEQALLEALAATTGWRVTPDGGLVLVGTDGAEVATFAADGPPRAE